MSSTFIVTASRCRNYVITFCQHSGTALSSRAALSAAMEAQTGSLPPHPALLESGNGLLSAHARSSIENASGCTPHSTRSMPASAFGAAEDENTNKSEDNTSSSDDGAVRYRRSYDTTTQTVSSDVLAQVEAVAGAQPESEAETMRCSAKRKRQELTPEVREEIRRLKEALFSSTGSGLYAPERGHDAFNFITQFAKGYQQLEEAEAYWSRPSDLLTVPDKGSVERCMDRTLLLVYLKKRFGYRTYLEIGCQSDANFDRVPFFDKVGVDPVSGGTVRATSDDFFRNLETGRKFDLVFIDGMHEASQVVRDVANALRFLSKRGTIVVHDCRPLFESEAAFPPPPDCAFWNGTVWKAIAYLRTCTEIDVVVCDFDWGLAVVRIAPNSQPLLLTKQYLDLTWADYEANYLEYLRLLPSLQHLHTWLERDEPLLPHSGSVIVVTRPIPDPDEEPRSRTAIPLHTSSSTAVPTTSAPPFAWPPQPPPGILSGPSVLPLSFPSPHQLAFPPAQYPFSALPTATPSIYTPYTYLPPAHQPLGNLQHIGPNLIPIPPQVHNYLAPPYVQPLGITTRNVTPPVSSPSYTPYLPPVQGVLTALSAHSVPPSLD